MKKDMSECEQIINGSRNFNDVGVYMKTIDQRLNIKQSCETSLNGAGDYCYINKTEIIKRDVQIQTNGEGNNDDTDMTIKSVVNEKLSDAESLNKSELETRLKRIEEENTMLRNRNNVLEDRIAFLEKKFNSEEARKEPVRFSPPADLSPRKDGTRGGNDGVSDLDFSRKFPESGVSAAGGDAYAVQSPSSIGNGVHVSSPSTSPAPANVFTHGTCSVTQTNITYSHGVSSGVTDINNLVTSVRTMASPLEHRPEIAGVQQSTASDVAKLQESVEMMSASPTAKHEPVNDSTNFEISVQRTNNGDLMLRSPTVEKHKAGPERSYDLQDDDIIVVTPSNNTGKPNGAPPELTHRDLPNRLEVPIPPRDSNRQRPRELSVSPHGSDKYRHLESKCSPISSPSELRGNKPIASFYKPDFYENMEAKRTSPHEARDPKVRLYEKTLLGEPSKSPPNTRREIVENRRRDVVAESLSREAEFRGNIDNARESEKLRWNSIKNNNYTPEEKYSTSAPSFSGFRSVADLPRSNSDSSIFPPRDKRVSNIPTNSTSMVLHRDDNLFNPNDLRAGEGLTTHIREYRHKEPTLLPNETKIDKITNTYINSQNPIHHALQRETPISIHQSMHRMTETGEKAISDMRRYDAGRRRDVLNSPNASLKASLKRTQMRPAYPDSRLVEYEPLSKVSVNPPPRPPPLIPNPNLSPNRYPGRNLNIPRSPVVRPNYPMTVPKYSNPAANYPTSTHPNYPTSAKYNISATNFHAISRANNYHLTTPNYMTPSPANFPSLYENHLNLPQLVAHITSDKSSIIFTWDKVDHTQIYVDNVDVYFLFAFHTLDLNQPPPKDNSFWKRISIVNALPLPIACTLTQSFDGQNYFFAVAAVNRAGVIGQLSNPCALKVAL